MGYDKAAMATDAFISKGKHQNSSKILDKIKLKKQTQDQLMNK